VKLSAFPITKLKILPPECLDVFLETGPAPLSNIGIIELKVTLCETKVNGGIESLIGHAVKRTLQYAWGKMPLKTPVCWYFSLVSYLRSDSFQIDRLTMPARVHIINTSRKFLTYRLALLHLLHAREFSTRESTCPIRGGHNCENSNTTCQRCA
jgi:hypothetical protein